MSEGTEVCVKEIKYRSWQAMAALLHEAHILSHLSHPSIAWLIAVQVQSLHFQLVTSLLCSRWSVCRIL